MPLDSTNWPTVEAEVDETTALLVRARGLVEHGWCRGVAARDLHGNPVSARDELAVSWCMTGAMAVAATPLIEKIFRSAFLRLGDVTGLSDGTDNYDVVRIIGEFNDAQLNVEPVLAAFDRAIAESANET